MSPFFLKGIVACKAFVYMFLLDWRGGFDSRRDVELMRHIMLQINAAPFFRSRKVRIRHQVMCLIMKSGGLCWIVLEGCRRSKRK